MSTDSNILSLSNAASIARDQYRHVVLTFVIGALLTFIPQKFQSLTTPFEMSMFIIAILVYGVSLATLAKLHRDNNGYLHVIVDKINMLSGSLAAISLVFIIVKPIGWLALLVWTLLLFKYIYDACKELRRLYQEMSSASNVFCQVFSLNDRHTESINPLPA